MARLLTIALLLIACACGPKKAVTRVNVVDDFGNVVMRDVAMVPMSSAPGLSICDDGLPSVLETWALAMRLACNEHPDPIGFSPIRTLPSAALPAHERILCGGTYPEDDPDDAKRLERECGVRSGWVTPHSE